MDIRDKREDYTVNMFEGKIERLNIALQGHMSLLRNLLGFYPHEWEEFCQSVCPIIESRSRRSREAKKKPGRPTKLKPQKRLAAVIMVMKNNDGCRQEGMSWNYSKTSANDDMTFVCEAIVEALMADEIKWPSAAEREASRGRLGPEFEGCIGHVDGSLCRINRSLIPNHKRYYNKRKAMYCMNSIVVIDHDGLFIYIDAGF